MKTGINQWLPKVRWGFPQEISELKVFPVYPGLDREGQATTSDGTNIIGTAVTSPVLLYVCSQ